MTTTPTNENDPQHNDQQQVSNKKASKSPHIDVEALFHDHQRPTTTIPFGPMSPKFARVHYAHQDVSPPPPSPPFVFEEAVDRYFNDRYFNDESQSLLHRWTHPNNLFYHVNDDHDDNFNYNRPNDSTDNDHTMHWEYTMTSPLSSKYHFSDDDNNDDDGIAPLSGRGLVGARPAPSIAVGKRTTVTGSRHRNGPTHRHRSRTLARPSFGTSI